MTEILGATIITLFLTWVIPSAPSKCLESQSNSKTFSPDYSPFLAPSEPDIFADDQQSPSYITKDCETFADRRICYQMQWKI